MASRAISWDEAKPMYGPPANPQGPTLPVTSLIERFAEALADLDDIAAASAAVRLPVGTGQMLFDRICKQLGRQAR